MARPWRSQEFDSLYERYICQEEMQFGGVAFYRRYRSRYKECVQRFAALVPPHPVDVLDVGGGQLALMCMKLWGDSGAVADLPGPHMTYMAGQGLETFQWNLCKAEPPFTAKFDFVFFVEVIEHLPIPGYITLERLRKVMRPGGVIICTTPNLYRLRNLLFMALGRPIFDSYFQYPDENVTLSHVLEYSRDHLDWQMKEGRVHAMPRRIFSDAPFADKSTPSTTRLAGLSATSRSSLARQFSCNRVRACRHQVKEWANG